MASKAIGIDLGTTYSCVGVFKNGRVEIIANNYGSRMTPSCVAFTDDHILVGDDARNQIAINAANTVYGVKRIIGRRFADEHVQAGMKHWPFTVVSGTDGLAIVQVQEKGQTKRYLPEQISSIVLGDLKATAENYLGHTVTEAVITIPASYGDAQRQGTFEAARLAGLNVLRLVNEPTAAALAYGFDNVVSNEPRNVLVFDLGGGTLDVSILSVDKNNNHYDVKATAGPKCLRYAQNSFWLCVHENIRVGGDDFDNRMLAHFSEEFKRRNQRDLSTDKRAVRRLYAVCERTKRTLSQSLVGSVEVDSLHGGRDFWSKIKREQFEAICADLFRNTIPPVERALGDARLRKQDIDEIVLAGGSSRIPKIQQLLQDYFNGQRLNKQINPDEAIAYGAAILAAKLSGTAVPDIQSIKLSEITGVSLGIKSYINNFVVCIPRGSRVPSTTTAPWTTALDYQTASSFEVYEGEDSLATNNKFLGSFAIRHAALPAGRIQFDSVMEIDASGVLHVSATETFSGSKNQIRITRRATK